MFYLRTFKYLLDKEYIIKCYFQEETNIEKSFPGRCVTPVMSSTVFLILPSNHDFKVLTFTYFSKVLQHFIDTVLVGVKFCQVHGK